MTSDLLALWAVPWDVLHLEESNMTRNKAIEAALRALIANSRSDGMNRFLADNAHAALAMPAEQAAERDNERYCLLCEKLGHITNECRSTHGVNTPAAREIFRLCAKKDQT